MTNFRASTDRKARAAMYREAAQAQECVNDYSCNTLSRVMMKHGHDWFGPVRDAYSNVFQPSNVWDEPEAAQQDIRVLMLCFMAAMVEAGDA